MLNARCYFHFSPDVLNTVVCYFADCYTYCSYRDVLSNKAINQLLHGKNSWGAPKAPKTALLLPWFYLWGQRAGRGWQASSMWLVTEALFPSVPHPALSLRPWVCMKLASAHAFSGTCASFLSLAIPHTPMGTLCSSWKAWKDKRGPSDPQVAFALFFCSYSAA